MAAQSVFSRQLLSSVGNFDLERFVVDDLIAQMANQIDAVLFISDGTDGGPTGLLEVSVR